MSSTGFTPEQKRIILERDGFLCCLCGRRAEVANHRAGRGAGGSKLANTLANGCALCHRCNGAIESDAELAQLARDRGVKLSRWDDPTECPYWSPLYRCMVQPLNTGDLVFA